MLLRPADCSWVSTLITVCCVSDSVRVPLSLTLSRPVPAACTALCLLERNLVARGPLSTLSRLDSRGLSSRARNYFERERGGGKREKASGHRRVMSGQAKEKKPNAVF